MTMTRYLTIGLSVLLLLAGCASTERKAVFSLDVDRVQPTRLMFPPESEGVVPRYVYLGHLYGERNFKDPEPETEGLLRVIGKALEIIKGDAPPQELFRPQSGVIDELGRILVADRGLGAVVAFNEAEGNLQLWQQAVGSRSFISPVGIALGPDGSILVSDSELALISRLDTRGNVLGTIGQGHLTRPTGIAYEKSSGRVFVVDTADHQVKIFNLKGDLLDVWGERGEGPGEFNFPTYIAVAKGRLYVADTINARVQVISSESGRHLATIGKLGIYVGNMVRPKGVSVDGEGNVYVVESFHDHLLIYNSRGEFLMSIGGVGSAPGQFHLPAGVWVDARNRVFVADTLNSRVSVFQFLGGGSESE